ncbi:MAG: TVP38/TMEM64 family protein [Proteobacteria bacterium]|nr:TVP38/TMEM64 family protein [Pseudomonadota bacterium]
MGGFKGRHFKVLVLLSFVVAALLLVRFTEVGRYLNPDALILWIEGFGALGPVVYIAIYSVAPVFMLPGLALTIVGGVLFGPVWGFLYVAVGATIGSGLAFIIARTMGRDWVAGLLKGPGMARLARVDELVKQKGWKVVAITRLIPLFPYNLLNYAFGLTSIKFSHYIVATLLFMLPGIGAYVLFSSSLPELLKGKLSPTFFLGLGLFVFLSVLAYLYKRYGKGSVKEL